MPEQSDSDGSYSAIRSVTHGASVYFLGIIANRGLRFAINLLMTRTLGTALYGIYTYANTLTSLGSTIANLGTDEAILKFVPQYEGDRQAQNRVLALAYLTSLGAGLLSGGAIFLAAPLITRLTLENPLLTDVLRLLAGVVAMTTLINCVTSVFRSLERPRYQILISEISIDVFRLIGIAIVILLGASLVGVVAAMVVAWLAALVFAFSVFFSRTDFSPTLNGSRKEAADFYNFSLPTTLGQTGSLIQNKVDILMVGFFLSPAIVGAYNVSLLLGQFITMPLLGFNQLFPSIASRLYSEGDMEELDSVYTRLTRWSFTVSLLPAIGVIIYSEEALAVFGEGFTRGAEILILFACARLILAAAGPSGNLLLMTGHQYLAMIDSWATGVLNIVLNYVFIVNLGGIGAALATATTMIVSNVITVSQIWYTEGMFPYSWAFLKPTLAGVGCAGAMVGWKLYSPFDRFWLLITGGVVGTIVFVLCLLILGLEQNDRQSLKALISRVKTRLSTVPTVD